jgi:GT2 family glycosyltransferase
MKTVCTRRYQEHPEYLASYRAFVQGDYALAARLLERLSEERPRSAELLNDLGICRYLSGEDRPARETLERAARLGGKSSSAAVNLLYLFRPEGFAVHDRGIVERTFRVPEGRVDLSGEFVSIILLEYNNPALTLDCLRSLREHWPILPFEVILIDNSEGGPPVDFRAASGLEEIRVQKNRENAGFAVGCNQGAALARGSFLLFVNNDTLFAEGAVEELARVLKGDGAVGIAGSRLLYRDDTIQHAGIVFTCFTGSPVHRCRYGLRDDPVANVPLKLQAVTGASLMIRHDLFRTLGGFSETYRNGYEDLDLCLKAGRAGWEVVYNPRSVLYHLESMSRNRTRHEEANLRLFRETWGTAVRRDELEYLGRNEQFLLSFTDNPYRAKRQRQVLGLVAHLARKHPGVAGRVPLACIESCKHLRFQRFARDLFSFLMAQGEPGAARSLFRHFLIRHPNRIGDLRAMRKAMP